MDHPELETLSAFLDGEATSEERAWIDQHVGGCPVCTVNLTVLERARTALKSLDEVSPTADERRQIRRAVLEKSPSRWVPVRTPRRAPLWGLAGAMVVVLGSFLFANLGRDAADQEGGAPLTALSQGSLALVEFESPEQVRTMIEGWPEVQKGIDLYTVADVGIKQEEAIAEVAPDPPAETAPSSGAGQSKRITVTPLPLDADYPAGSDQRCLRSVLQAQRHPTMPLLVRQAVFKSEPAWLLVYVWTPQLEGAAKLDRLQYWLVAPSDCRTLNYSSLRL